MIHAIAPNAASTTQGKAATVQLSRGALNGLGLKGLPLKPELVKALKAQPTASLDDSTETVRKLEMLGDMPAVDMSMNTNETSVGENLEVDDDDDEADRLDAEVKRKAREFMEVDDDDEADPLDAFMNDIKAEVKKVTEEDLKRMKTGAKPSKRFEDRMDADTGSVAEDVELVEDELDATELNPEDILALAAKKARKKELATVDHTRINYEPFRKEFYHPPPEVADMSADEVDLLRLELDGIKIRGVDCPRPVTKWSHCGLPAVWHVQQSCVLTLFCAVFKPINEWNLYVRCVRLNIRWISLHEVMKLNYLLAQIR